MQTTPWIAGRSLILYICIAAIAGAALYSVVTPEPIRPALDAVLNQEAKIEGVIVRDPDRRDKTGHLTVRIEKIDEAPIGSNVRILVFADRFVDVAYGDRIIVTGKVKKPESFETDSERTFDYPKYLLSRGITHTVSFGTVSMVESGQGNPVLASLISLKHFFIRGIETALPAPESALLSGLLLGEKQSLGEKITEAFRNAGVIHIIVLSGYNVALVIRAVLAVAGSLLPRAIAFSIAGISILAFALMTGASETTIRASVMAGIVLIAQLVNRPTEGVRILLIAAAGMAIWNPYLVLYDLSYQLSILATLGLILFSDRIAKKIEFVTDKLGFREIVATTIGTQITVLPILILSIGQVSLVSLFANVLVLPAVAGAMLTGFIASLLALVSSMLAFPVVTVAYAFLAYIISVSVWFGNLPFSSLVIPASWALPTLATLLLIYGVVFWLWSRKNTSAS